jgi:hypothetical protein
MPTTTTTKTELNSQTALTYVLENIGEYTAEDFVALCAAMKQACVATVESLDEKEQVAERQCFRGAADALKKAIVEIQAAY